MTELQVIAGFSLLIGAAILLVIYQVSSYLAYKRLVKESKRQEDSWNAFLKELEEKVKT